MKFTPLGEVSDDNVTTREVDALRARQVLAIGAEE